MIEESIQNLTDEIRELKEVLSQLVSAYVKFELTDWSDVDVVNVDETIRKDSPELALVKNLISPEQKKVDSEQTEVATKHYSPEPVAVKNSPEPATVKEMSDAKALAIVSGEKVEEIDLPSIDDMYAAVMTHIRDHSEVTDTIKEWVAARGAKTLRKVDESYRQECYDFLTALGVSL